MAKVLSGSFDTTSKNNRYLTFSWSATQDYENNETTISWQLKCNGTATTYNMSAPFSVIIDGEEVYYSSERIKLTVGKVVASGTKTLTHNSNGAKSFTASAKAAIYDATYNVSGKGTWQLEDIPRGAVLTKVPATFTDEDSPTIEFTNYLGNSVDSVSVCLSLDNYYATIPYRAVGKTDTSYKFEFTDDEKAKIYEYTETTNSLSVSFYILTVIKGVEYRNKLYSTLKIINANPEITSFTAEDTLEDSLALTGDGNKMIWGMNNIHLVATPLLKKGATLDYAYIQENKGGYIESLEGDIPSAYSPLFEAYVRDSRGNEVYRTVELEYIDYIPLTCNFEAEIKLSETNTENAEVESRIYGNYFNNSFGAVNNTLSVKLEYNGSDGGYREDIITLTSEDFDGNTYDKTITQNNLSYKETWVVKAIVMDYIIKLTKESKKLTALPVFDWSKEDFNFNVPITYQTDTKLVYTPGDSITLGDVGACFSGFVSNAKKQLIFTIPLSKPLCGITGVYFEGDIMCRSINGYINGTAYNADTAIALDVDEYGTPTDDGFTSMDIRINDCGITVILNTDTAITNATMNNAPVIVVPYTELTINFT